MRRLRRPRAPRARPPRHPDRRRAPPPLRAPAPLESGHARRRRAHPRPRRRQPARPWNHLRLHAEAVAIDRTARTVRLADGATLPYTRLLLATGATPRRLPLASPRAAYLRTFDDALALRARLHARPRVAIIGGGFIGLELASSARQLGCPVTVIESQPRLLQRGVPAPLAATLHAAHERHGTRILSTQPSSKSTTCPTPLTSASPTAPPSRPTSSSSESAPSRTPPSPNAAGLATANGITVDAFLATSDPAIFAAGDCCAFPLALYGNRRVRLESWRNAREQGALAGRNMAGADEPHAAVPWFWTDQFDLGLQIAGLPDEGTETIRRDLADDAFLLFHLDAAGRLVAASGIGPGTTVARDIRLAEMLIARRAVPPRPALAAADVRLKGLLAS